MTQVVTRFAPSPTGHLHIGGARTAIFCWLLARHFNGRFHLRIEDTDLLRSKQEYTDSILASMRWLGLDWDGEPVYQTNRTELYNSYVDKLLQAGHAYWCSCTPEEVESRREEARQAGRKPRYNGRCRTRDLGPGEGRCVRLKTPLSGKVVFDDMVKGRIAVDVSELDDMVIRRADGMPTYNMAVVVDDHSMGITHVIRGDDHVSNTPRQILIYEALGLPVPRFGHVPMILGPDRQKLSKRHGARAVIEYKQDGLLPQALVNYLVRLGWSHGDQEIFTREEMIKLFSLGAVSKSASAFNTEKLQWLNHHYINALAPEYVATHLQWHIEQENSDTRNGPQLADLVKLLGERCKTLKEMAQSCRYFYEDFAEFDADAAKKHLRPVARQPLEVLRDKLAVISEWTAENVHHAIQATADELEVGMGKVGMPLRVAVTGAGQSPALDVTVHAIGKSRSIDRINKALAFIAERESQQ